MLRALLLTSLAGPCISINKFPLISSSGMPFCFPPGCYGCNNPTPTSTDNGAPLLREPPPREVAEPTCTKSCNKLSIVLFTRSWP